MINLIPNKEKKKKVKDFYFRLFVVLLSMLGACIFVAVVALLPAYFLSSVEKNLAHTKLAEQKSSPQTPADKNLSSAVTDLNTKLRMLETARESTYSVSRDVVYEITERKMADIRITKISYELAPDAGKKVLVQGLAPSRERLLLFRQALEESEAFAEVRLPISNFVKGSNIEFSMTLIPRP